MSETSLNISEIDETPPPDDGLNEALETSWDELADEDGAYPYDEAFGHDHGAGEGAGNGAGAEDAGAIHDFAPGDFTAEEREAFAALAPDAQSLVSSYAARSHASRVGLANELDGMRRQFGPIGETLNRYAPYMQMLGASPDEVVAGVMPYYLRLAGGDAETRRETIDYLAHQFGVGPGQQGAQHTNDNADPQVQALRMEMNAMKQHQAAAQQAVFVRQLGAAEQHVDGFLNARDENGALRFPDFDRLEDAMLGLMQGGLAHNLDDAYAKAAALDPDLQAAAITGRTAAARRRASDAARAAKRAASVNRRGRNAPAAQRLALTIDDSINEAWDELYG